MVMIHPRTSLSSGVSILPPPLPRSAVLQLRIFETRIRLCLLYLLRFQMDVESGVVWGGGYERTCVYTLNRARARSDISSSQRIESFLYTSLYFSNWFPFPIVKQSCAEMQASPFGVTGRKDWEAALQIEQICALPPRLPPKVSVLVSLFYDYSYSTRQPGCT